MGLPITQEFRAIRAAMKVLSFDDSEIWNILRLLAALLHMGNLKYKSTFVQNIEASEVNDSTNAGRVAALLEVSKSLLTNALTRKTISIQGERVITTISKEAALDARDAFVKGIYGKIFVRLVEKINMAIYKKFPGERFSIGVLDIFGFENFNVNSFEQLCINYANENLQQFFVRHIFKLEQEEYTREGIDWHHIEFVDNQSILDLIAMKPMNLLALIDEETKFPKGTDASMLAKLYTSHVNNNLMHRKLKSDQSLSFGIQHFAGVVCYSVVGFLEKNRDAFSNDFKELIMQSNNQFLVELFQGETSAVDYTGKRAVTLSWQFRVSLEALMRTLSACQPSFIRCIKPNDLKKPNVVDTALFVRQIRYSGIIETAKIRRAGFPIRHSYKEFVDRYRHILPGIGPSHKVDCFAMTHKICQSVIPQSDIGKYQFGHSKVFLKDGHDSILENERNRIYLKHIVLLQRNFRMAIFRRFIRRYREAAVVLQKHWRALGHRRRYLVMRQGYARLQACIRSRQLAYSFSQKRKLVVRLQAHCRGFLTRKWCRDVRNRYQGQEANKKIALEVEARNRATLSAEEEQRRRENMSFEQENEVVDDLFKFLSESSPVPEPRNKVGMGVSKMLLFFEDQSRNKKPVPSKLLSRPVNVYTYESRL